MKKKITKIITSLIILVTIIISNIGSLLITSKAMNMENSKQESITVLEENASDNTSLEKEKANKDNYSPVYNIAIVPEVIPYLNVNDSEQLRVMAILEDGTQRDITNEAEYSSDKSNVVSVDEKGLLSAKKVGKAKIQISYKKMYATTCVVVTDNNVSGNVQTHELNINGVNTAISDIKSMYDKFDGNKVYRYNVLLGYGLMDANEKDMSKISSRINKYAGEDLDAYAKNIMALVSSNKDPKEYADKILALGEKLYNNKSANSIASAVLALDMAEVPYDAERAIKALLDKGYVRNDLMYYSSVEETAEVLRALAFHQNIDGVKSAIEKIKNCLKLQQCPDGMIKEHNYDKDDEDCSATAKVVSALVALGEDPNSVEWTKMDGNKPNSLIDGIIKCNYGDGRFRKEPYDQYFIAGTYSADVFQAFNEVVHKRSAYTLRYTPQKGAAKICVYDGEKEINSLELEELEEKELTAKTFDENGRPVTNNELLWESEDKSIAEVSRGIVKGIKKGNTKIIIKAGNENSISREILVTVKEIKINDVNYNKEISELQNNLSQFLLNCKNYSGKLNPIIVYTLMSLDNLKIKFDTDRYEPTKIFSDSFVREQVVLNNTLGSYILGKEYEIFSKKLSDYQMEDGRFSSLSKKGSLTNKSDVETQANSIWALDIVNQPYRVNDAVRELLYYAKDTKNYKTVQDTALALIALSKHKDIDGVNEIIKSSLEYIKACQKETGGFADKGKKESVEIDADVIRALIANGENIFSDKWTCYGKNPVDAIMEPYKGIDYSKAKSYDLPMNSDRVLFALTQIKVKDEEEPKEEKTCKVNISIAISNEGKYECVIMPQQVTISDQKHKAGFTALGALQAATTEYTMRDDMVTAIYGLENQGKSGWIYTINGMLPNKMASKMEVKEEDKIIWYYSMAGMGGPIPTWEELTGEKIAVTGVELDKENIILEEGETTKLTAVIIPKNATNKKLSWSSSDTNIAVVDNNGSITGIKEGNATITITSEDGQKTAKCNIEVKAKKNEKEIDIRNLTGQKEFKLDSEARVTIQAVNKCKDKKNIIFIIALFDDKDNMVKYAAVKNVLIPQDISELEGIMNLPKEGSYKVKAFVWDNFTKRNLISDEIIIPVVE